MRLQTFRSCTPEARPLSPPNMRIGPRHPRLGGAGFRAARWLRAHRFRAAGFHQLGSDFADERIAYVREKLGRGETIYLAGLGPPGTHNSGAALVDVSQANGPRWVVHNEERALLRKKPPPRISAGLDRSDGRDAARHGTRHRRYRRLAHQLGLPGTGRHAGALGAGGTAAKLKNASHH